MTRARAAFALAKASSMSPSPCPITRGFALAASAAARNPACTASAARLNDVRRERQHEYDRTGFGADVRVGYEFRVSDRPRHRACRRRFACRRSLRSGQCRAMRTRRRSRIRHRASAFPHARSSRSGGGRSYERGRISHGRSGGARQVRMTRPPLSRGAGNIICGCHAARKSARPDAAGGRRPGQRGRDRGRGYARDRRAAAALRHRDAPDLAPRAQRSGARRRDRRELARRTQRGAGQRCRHAGDQRSGRASGARGARRRVSPWCRFPAPAPRSPRCPRRGSMPSACCSWAFFRRRRRRGASSWRSVAREPCALVIYEAPHRVRATAAELGAALGGERSLVVAREITKKFETITQMTLAEAPDWFAADPNRERGEFVLLVDAPAEPAIVSLEDSSLDAPPAADGAGRRVAAGARRASRGGRDRTAARRALCAGARAQGARGAEWPRRVRLERCRLQPACRRSRVLARRAGRMGRAPRSPLRARGRANGAGDAAARRPVARAEGALSRGRRRLPGDHRASAGRHRRRRFAGDRDRCRRGRARAAHHTRRREVVPLRRIASRDSTTALRVAAGALVEWLPAGDDPVRRRAGGDRACASSSPRSRGSSAGTSPASGAPHRASATRRVRCASRSSSFAMARSCSASARRSTAAVARAPIRCNP